MHVVLSVIFVAGIAVSLYVAVLARRPNHRKIDRLERRLGMRPSYDLRRRSRGGRS
jgi:hypothetical protein